MKNDDRTRAPAVMRAGALIDEITMDSGEPVRVNELARRIGVPKSSISNICVALEQLGVLRRTDAGLVLGAKLAEWGGAYLDTNDHIERFHASVKSLLTIGLETVQLAVLAGFDVVYLARHEGMQQIRLASAIGRKLPVSTTAIGKAILASLPDNDIEELLEGAGELPKRTAYSITSKAELWADIEKTRVRGYAIDNQETAAAITCLGVVIPNLQPDLDRSGMSCTLLSARVTDQLIEAIVEDLNSAAELLKDPFESRATLHR